MSSPFAHAVLTLEAPGGNLEAPGGTRRQPAGRPQGVIQEFRDALVRRFVATRPLDTQCAREHCPTG